MVDSADGPGRNTYNCMRIGTGDVINTADALQITCSRISLQIDLKYLDYVSPRR